ncbi:uncharacterized protein PHACADRAFT_263293 [Phanerochaete carnosa HHB-10118-sp]|uniref:Hydrophobin n=1 Tax=Phanerochaete carnosa (strain HHB-10118-sp) TaxID=650164 RepID=K5VWS1_PHACS|nr:uncharacterized protein PHACADRAFT_263293 [Phanerochaete carnosa HHB-10118-sp]EKM51250.1 hypothetical protein PHACADRAFT_263293 [Phanerochaete carnosa HHB-10118-sp]
MQLFRTLVPLALVAGALASPHLVKRTQGSCNAGPAQCCQSVQPASSSDASSALKTLLDIPIQDLNVPIGLNCLPINVVGVGNGADCASTPVCCNSSYKGGLVNVGCTPAIVQG